MVKLLNIDNGACRVLFNTYQAIENEQLIEPTEDKDVDIVKTHIKMENIINISYK